LVSGAVIAYFTLDWWITSDYANCSDQRFDDIITSGGIEFTYRYRRCGMLYGGPFLLVLARPTTGIESYLGAREALLVDDAEPGWRPDVTADTHEIVVTGVPAGKLIFVQKTIFGRTLVER
jgi:hypothetical protein